MNCLTIIYSASLKIANLHDFPKGNFQKIRSCNFSAGPAVFAYYMYGTGCPVAYKAKSQTLAGTHCIATGPNM